MSGHPLDLPAMAAWGAFYGIDAATVAEDWPMITPRTREKWRAAVDAARMVFDLAPGEFGKPGDPGWPLETP